MRFVTQCQVCGSSNLDQVLSLGYMPPVNQMIKIGERGQQDWLPTDLLHCGDCQLVQLSIIADKEMVFPADYPYTSGTTKLLRQNFDDLQRECWQMFNMTDDDLVVDIGSNDGTLLSYFKSDARKNVIGIEPTDVADIANKSGINTMKRFFCRTVVDEILQRYGKAKLITMANCFAHIEDVHEVIENVKLLLADDGVFVTESHYLDDLLSGLQFDTIYHEHLRYYSVGTLQTLFRMHGMEIFHIKRIPTHGGSIRVYAGKDAKALEYSGVSVNFSEPQDWRPRLDRFAMDVQLLKYKVLHELSHKKMAGHKIVGISAPSRSATLINYIGLDEDIIDYVCEIKGSLKIGRYMPGTQIPIVDEEILQREQPDNLLILSWHIADELVPKLRSKGLTGSLLIPLPTMRIAA